VSPTVPNRLAVGDIRRPVQIEEIHHPQHNRPFHYHCKIKWLQAHSDLPINLEYKLSFPLFTAYFIVSFPYSHDRCNV
jgi:hypothetical protein